MHKSVPGLFLAAMSWNVSHTGGCVDRHVAVVMVVRQTVVVLHLLFLSPIKAFFDLTSVNIGEEGSLCGW